MFVVQQCGLVRGEAAPYSGWPVCNWTPCFAITWLRRQC